jgi:hypothetical protein
MIRCLLQLRHANIVVVPRNTSREQSLSYNLQPAAPCKSGPAALGDVTIVIVVLVPVIQTIRA